MNKEERKRLINAIHTHTNSIIVNSFDIETEMRQPWKNITH